MDLGAPFSRSSPKPKRWGVPGVDLTQTPRIDQKLIDRIGQLVEEVLKKKRKKLLAARR